MSSLRLHKYIAQNSTLSRRKAEELIENGKVKLNGQKVKEPGVSVDPSKDTIEVIGYELKKREQKKYFLLHKPAGCICAVSDPHGQKTVLDFFPDFHQDVYPVGRLDKESTGLILLTNDGDFAYKYTHPKFDHEKEYIVKINGNCPHKLLDQLNSPFVIDGYKTKKALVKKIVETDNVTHLSFVLKEGRKRQIREMVKQCGRKVLSLKRIRIDDIYLDGMPEGRWEKLPYSFVTTD